MKLWDPAVSFCGGSLVAVEDTGPKEFGFERLPDFSGRFEIGGGRRQGRGEMSPDWPVSLAVRTSIARWPLIASRWLCIIAVFALDKTRGSSV